MLDVSWAAANPAPTDYRVNWARSGESYPSWTEDTGNRYPTTTSLQLTGLDEGMEYKVQVRARYYDGEHEDNSWSGTWAEEFLQVAGNPPPTPEPTTEPTPEDTPETDGSGVSDFEKGELVASHSFGSGPSQGRAIWSDGETIWITRLGGRADAYGLSDMARQPEKDIRAMYGAFNHHANGIWSDGQTMWISDDGRARIFAYSLQSDNQVYLAPSIYSSTAEPFLGE